MTQQEQKHINKNIFWIIAGGVSNSLLAFIGSIFVARLLDVTNYGILQLAITYFLFIQTLENIVHPNVTKILMLTHPKNEEDYVVASAAILFWMNLVVMLLMLAIYGYNHQPLFLYLAIMTVGQVFRASNGVAFRLDIKLQSKKVQISQAISFTIANIYRISAAFVHPTIIPQTFSVGLGSGINTFFLLLFSKDHRLSFFKPKLAIAKEIIVTSTPMLLVALITFLVYKADILILGFYKLDNDISFYSNAVKLSEPWAFIATAFVNSMMPGVIAARKRSFTLYYEKIKILMGILIWFSIFLALVGMFFSREIILLTYGPAYLASSAILKVHIWSNVFLFIMAAQQLWELNESMKKFLVLKMSLAAIINIVLNFIFIPIYGGMACAVISVLTYALIAIIFNCFNKKASFLNRQIFASIFYIRQFGAFLRSGLSLLRNY